MVDVAAGPGRARGRGLAVRGAVVRYGDGGRGGEGTTAVAGVDLDVAEGEILALLGPSGCGKSSLLRAVAGLEPLAAGSVAFDGDDLAGVPVHRRGFGLLFQDGQLFAHRDVARNVAYGLETARVRRQGRLERVRELLDAVGLDGYGRRSVATLSGGERQRVALARALAPRPRLLLLDEPFSALDRGLRERLAVDVRDVLRATGTTAVFVTHDHDEAFTVADRVGVMQAGRLLQVAPPRSCGGRPRRGPWHGSWGIRGSSRTVTRAGSPSGPAAWCCARSGLVPRPGGRGARRRWPPRSGEAAWRSPWRSTSVRASSGWSPTSRTARRPGRARR
ncbi:ABC transporter ATP-binding protein [Xylanimonas allomyrinae]|uniref:ABC transporter ATP-binding protein n=1 Tax=Xylanimonas allomyrinae TaxID=2509459 RepID=UPI0026A2A473